MDPWQELLDALQQLASHELPDVARRARRALVCYNRCVVQADVTDEDDEQLEDIDPWDFYDED